MGKDANPAKYMRRASTISAMVKNIPTMTSEVYMPEIASHVPNLILACGPKVVGMIPKEVHSRLQTMRPRIELNPATGTTVRIGTHSNENTIIVGTWMLQPGKAEIVGQHLKTSLSSPRA